jgi:vitamin B12 transporter
MKPGNKGRGAPRWQRLAIFAGVLGAGGLHAQTQGADSIGADSIVVVTAARQPQALDDVVPDTTVLTRQDIERAQTTDLVDLLGRQAGIEFAQLGGPGRQASVFMRGSNSNQVLVLVDGVPLNSALDGAPALGRIATDSIERIEIVRGNLSSLYGSSAVGGVIQIFTRTGGAPGGQAQAEAGSRGTRAASGSVGTQVGGVSLTASAGWREQDAISAIDASQVPHPVGFVLGANPATDPTRNVDGSLALAHRDPSNELAAWIWASHGDTSFDSAYDGPTASHREHASFDVWGSSARHRFAPGTSLALSYGQSRDHSVDDYAAGSSGQDAPTSFAAGRFESRNRQVTLQGDLRVIDPLQLQAGVSRLDQQGGTNQYDPSFASLAFTAFERRVDSLWLGAIGRSGRQELQFNARHDQYSDFGGATTGLAGWSLGLAPGWRAVAQWSSAFRAPSFDDLHFPGGNNPALKPERARTGELGLRWAAGPARASLSLYRTRTDELIVFDPATFVPNNIGHAAVDGAELQAALTSGPWSLGGNLGLMRARDADTGQALVRRARYVARLAVAWTSSAWRVGAEWSRSGAREDFDINTNLRTQLAPYSLARLTLQRELAPHLAVRLRIENLFNAHYQLVDGYNTLPRMVLGGLEARM